MYQDPKNGFEEGQPLDKEGIERLTKLCIDKILEDRGPLMETVRMQVGSNFRCNFNSDVLDLIVQINIPDLMIKIPLITSILDTI